METLLGALVFVAFILAQVAAVVAVHAPGLIHEGRRCSTVAGGGNHA